MPRRSGSCCPSSSGPAAVADIGFSRYLARCYMKGMGYLHRTLLGSFLFLLLPLICQADPGNDYCITPAFVTASIKPNLLLMIDNSASMFDLAYSDRGKKHCAAHTTTSCLYDSDCPTGDTCSVFDRQPYYCYDETYSNSNTYTGYFEPATYYSYRSGTDDFAVLA